MSSKVILTVFILLFIPSIVIAQWTDNPAVNIPIANTAGIDQVQPKIVNHTDGTAYISWLQNNNGYDVYLQRIDANGNKLWDDKGIVVAARNYTSTQDYGLSIDFDGNAVITFRDDRFDGERVTVNRVAPDGTLLWGSNGVAVSTGGFIAEPKVIVASNNTIIAAYTGEGFVGVTALDLDGTVLWYANQTGSSPFALSDINPSDAPNQSGEFIVMMQTFGPPTVPRRLFAQKINANGANLWGSTPVQIMTESNLQFGNFPDFIPDGNGGMFVSWYQVQPGLNVKVQGIRNDGSFYFPENGIFASENTSRLRVNPSIVLSPDEDLYIFWIELNSNQSQSGLYGQKLAKDGQRMWGSTGKVFVPLAPPAFTGTYAALFGNDPVVFYTRNTTSVTESHIRAARISTDGDFVWPGDFVAISDIPSSHSRLSLVNPNPDEVFIAWQQSSTPANIFAQNLHADGELGIKEDDTHLITFQVNMSVQQFRGYFDSEIGDRLYVRGEFNNFELSDDWELMLSSDFIFEGSFEIDAEPGEIFEYKFFVESGDGRDLPNTGWEGSVGDGSSGNRTFELDGGEQILPLVFFNNEDQNLGVFNLLTPENDSFFELNPDGDEMIVFTWEESDGADFYYVEFLPNIPNVSTNWVYDSDQDGSTTQLTISESIIANLILNADFNLRSGTMEWVVWGSRGNEERVSETAFTFDYSILSPSSTERPDDLPLVVQLHQNYPNPFNPTTLISYSLPETGFVELTVFDSSGRRVATLQNGYQSAGNHSISFDGSALASGLYVYRLQMNGIIQNRKMMLVK